MSRYLDNIEKERQKAIQKQLIKFQGKTEIEDFVRCAYCEMISSDLTSHISRTHGISAKEYAKSHPLRAASYSRASSIRISGDKNPAYQHGGRLSAWSKKSAFYNPKSNALAQKNKTSTCTLDYFLKQTNGDEQKAAELLSKRQTTFSLEKCIQRHGQEKGREIWEDRQKKWMTTMTSKSLEEQLLINSKKIGKGYTVSKAERKIAETLIKYFPAIEIQKTLIHEKRFFIYDIALGKKIIEYNGDYWHTNPIIYKEDYYHQRQKMTAKEIWKKDQLKISIAEKQGFEIIIIWESDYKKDPKTCVEKCLNFLMS